MKHVIFILLATCLSLGAWAQNKQILYGFEDIPQSLLVNPGGKTQLQKHYGIPFFSQIHFNGGASGISAYDIFGGSGDINEKIDNKIFEMEETDFFSVTQQLEILSFGWRTQQDYYLSGGVYQEFDFIFYYPRDLAILGWNGNQAYLDYEFDLGQLSTTGDLLTVYHFGANKALSNKLTVGLRAKFYSSILSYRSVGNQGTFVTTRADSDAENIYEHRLQDINMRVETSGIANLDEGPVGSKLLGRALFGGNLGVGVDVGATYDITDRLQLSASALDVGAIFHTKNTENYSAQGDYTLDGIELLFPPLSAGDETFPYYDNLEDEILEEVAVDTTTNSYTQMRPMKLNGALQYRFGKILSGGVCDCRNMGKGADRDQAIGVQFFSMARPKGWQMAGTVFYYRRIFDFLSAKATYTYDAYETGNVGIGISTTLNKFNFYLAVDNLLRYGNLAKAKSVSLQFGFNIKMDTE
ncbi:DUF5723 family protein [Altibacter sp. HG106]|uniref:DUF5723 family protein n=1 Tax=Altibacter sp. HG106 TaxID=3023937 RepID=UPI0023503D7A|nr:DUF5723 family protein [Altibacter sp. HG106]MDC7995977.1 DUF5723 family protein [Altibacter sp. HG106]